MDLITEENYVGLKEYLMDLKVYSYIQAYTKPTSNGL